MKILFISNLFPDSSQPIHGLDNATLLHHLKQRHKVRVIALRPRRPWQASKVLQPRTEDVALDIRYQAVRYLPLVGSGINHRMLANDMRQQLCHALDEFQPDVILASWMYPDCCGLATLKADGIINCPIVAIAQGTDIHTYLKQPKRREVILKSLPQFAAVITRSADLAKRIQDAGWQTDNLYPIYNGIDTQLFRPLQDGDTPPPHLETDERNIIFIGNLLPVKAPDQVINAFSIAMARLNDDSGKLLIIGDGPLREELASWCNEYNATGRVLHLGRMPTEQVAQYLRYGDALLMASLNEGVPNVVLEAFASGVPVLSTDVGGIHEVLTEGEHGYLVPAGNTAALGATLASCLDEQLDKSAIRQHGEQFTWANTVSQYEEILEAAVNG